MQAHHKVISLREKWGKQQTQLQQLSQKLNEYTVNLTKIMQEISQDDGCKKTEGLQQEQQQQDLQNKNHDRNGDCEDIQDDPNLNEKEVVDNVEQNHQKGQEKDNNNNDSLLNESLNIVTEAESQNVNESERSSLAIEGGSTYTKKCRIFESALRKIEIDDFVIYDKVDEYLKMKEAQKVKHKEIKQFDELLLEQSNQANNETNVKQPGQKSQMSHELRHILLHKNQQSGKFEISSNRKRAQKYIYKQLENDCRKKLGVNNVFQQMSRMLSFNIKEDKQQSRGRGHGGDASVNFGINKRDPRDTLSQTRINSYFTHNKSERKQSTIAKSPKPHLKERASIKEDPNPKTDSKTTNGKASVFKALKLNKKILIGASGIPPAQERPSTQFVEFDLSYKKQKTTDKENNNHPPHHPSQQHQQQQLCNTTTPKNVHTLRKDGRISVKKVVAIGNAMITPKTTQKKQALTNNYNLVNNTNVNIENNCEDSKQII